MGSIPLERGLLVHIFTLWHRQKPLNPALFPFSESQMWGNLL